MYCIYVDEAGRWPIAWPVFVGLIIEELSKRPWLDWFSDVAVFSKKKKRWDVWKKTTISSDLFPVKDISHYNNCIDSKLLSSEQRENIYSDLIGNKKITHITGSASAKEIDAFWIVWAIRKAIFRAIHSWIFSEGWQKLTHRVFSQRAVDTWIKEHRNDIMFVIDGPSDFELSKKLTIPVVPVIDGDALIPMISAASILAKVERDAYMTKLKDKKYGFAKHKGYWTKEHYQAIEKHWLSKEHRSTFIHVL